MGNRPEPDEAPEIPKHQKKAPKKKRFGIEYFRRGCIGSWTHRDWYVTAKARDQAFDDFASKFEGDDKIPGNE